MVRRDLAQCWLPVGALALRRVVRLVMAEAEDTKDLSELFGGDVSFGTRQTISSTHHLLRERAKFGNCHLRS